MPPARSGSLAGQLPDGRQNATQAQHAPHEESDGVHNSSSGVDGRAGYLLWWPRDSPDLSAEDEVRRVVAWTV